jgi:hypothetical protein
MMEGAFPASAKAYKVREAIYRSELEADITNNRIHAFKKPGRTRTVSLFAMRAIVTGNLGILNCHHERRCSCTGVLISASAYESGNTCFSSEDEIRGIVG